MKLLLIEGLRKRAISVAVAIGLTLSVGLVLLSSCSSGGGDNPDAASENKPTSTADKGIPTVGPTQMLADPTSIPTPTPSIGLDSEILYVPNQDGADFLMIAGDHLYVGGTGSGFVSRRDLKTGESAGSIRGGREGLQGMTFDGESIWTSDFTAQQIRKIGLDGSDLGRFDISSPRGIDFGADHIWVVNGDVGTVTKLDLNGNIVGEFDAGKFPSQVAADGDGIWVTNVTEDTVTNLSTDGELIATIDLGIGRRPRAIVSEGNYVWVTNGFAFLTRISKDTLETREFNIGRVAGNGRSGQLAVDGDHVWVTSQFGETFGTVSQLTSEGKPLARIVVGGNAPTEIAVADGTVYVGVDVGRKVAVIPPAKVAMSQIKVPSGLVELDVTIDVANGTYSGVITLPDTPGPHPAALFINGSGASSHEMLFTWPWGRDLAQSLAAQGIAVLSVDDPGIGRSSGRNMNTTLEQRVEDAADMVAVLRTMDGIDGNKVGLIGFSEGAAVAAALAAQIESAFFVSIAGPVAPHKELLPLQTERFLQASSSAESYIDAVLTDLAAAHDSILTGEGLEELTQQIELGSAVIIAPDYILGDAEELLTPWYRSFLEFDPGIYWGDVDEPVLAVFGDKDWAVPAEQNEPLLRTILSEAGHGNYRIETLTGVNHFFQTSQSGAIGEFSTNPREFAPGFLELISSWLIQTTES